MTIEQLPQDEPLSPQEFTQELINIYGTISFSKEHEEFANIWKEYEQMKEKKKTIYADVIVSSANITLDRTPFISTECKDWLRGQIAADFLNKETDLNGSNLYSLLNKSSFLIKSNNIERKTFYREFELTCYKLNLARVVEMAKFFAEDELDEDGNFIDDQMGYYVADTNLKDEYPKITDIERKNFIASPKIAYPIYPLQWREGFIQMHRVAP